MRGFLAASIGQFFMVHIADSCALEMRYRVFSRSYSTIKSVLSDPKIGSEAKINGWVRSVRKLKSVAFADVTDGTTHTSMPVIMTPQQAKSLTTGACIEVIGKLKQSPGSQQDIELEASDSPVILGPSAADYPLQKKYHSPEFLRSLPQFRWKTQVNSSTLRYRSYALSQISRFYEENDYTQVNSPLLTSSDCEGAGEVFSVTSGTNPEFFGKKAYLSVSSQLHLEVYAAALSRVWNMAPAFRAEESDTNRHLSEFWMIEAEAAFVNSLEEITSVAEGMIRAAVPKGKAADNLLQSIRSPERKELVENRWKMLSGDSAWPRITYTEALKLLSDARAAGAKDSEGLTLPTVSWSDGLASAHEKYLSEHIFKSPVFVTDYPKEIKPFYMKSSGDKTVAAFDLVVPGMGELIGGSLREDNYETLKQKMEKLDMDLEDLDWYLKLRQYGSFPHGGFGMGFERLVCFMCGIENIRDAIGFPRWANHIKC